MTPQSAREWGAALTVWLGYALLIFISAVWYFTDRIEPLLVTTAALLLGVGYGGQALAALRAPQPPPALPPSTEDGNGGAS